MDGSYTTQSYAGPKTAAFFYEGTPTKTFDLELCSFQFIAKGASNVHKFSHDK